MAELVDQVLVDEAPLGVDRAALADRRSGLLVAIEGADGSGKSTLVTNLAKQLRDAGRAVVEYKYPDYQDPLTGELVGSFLRGELGDVEDVAPELVALMFAANKNGQLKAIEAELGRGAIVLLDRFTYSNVAFQSAKLPAERSDDAAAFMSWVKRVEQEIFACPDADLTIWMKVGSGDRPGSDPTRRPDRDYLNGSIDIHENDQELQARVEAIYQELATSEPSIKTIEVFNSGLGRLRPPKQLASEALELVLEAERGLSEFS